MTQRRRRGGEAVLGFDPPALREARRSRGLSLDALGELTRVSRASLILYEKGCRRPGLETLGAIADALGVDSLDLTLSPSDAPSLGELRLRAGLTKTELASRLGVARTTWDRIERGRWALPPDWARALAGWLGVTAEEVVAARARGLAAFASRRRPPGAGGGQERSPANVVVGNLRGRPALNRFVGRDRELTELRALVPRSRLLTLVGPAGVGKSRLALELARVIAGDHPDGRWLVELASTRDPALVPQAAATVLGVLEHRGLSAMESLVRRLRDSRLLLVLDNCEHVAGAAADLVTQVLAACPGVACIVTSQQPLAIRGERAWSVPPLLFPKPEQEFEAVGASDAVRLFCERAATHRPGFVLTPAIAVAVGDICRRLDGIPLAIELAAGRVSVLAPAEIAARLDDRFALLTGGSGGERHQTLRNALEWSHNLLPEAERALLRRLSIFVGGCSFEAVAVVCRGDLGNEEGLLDALAALVSKSLVTADTSGDRARYRLLETVRLFAGERLAESGEAAELRARHLEWCMSIAERAESALTGPDQVTWLERIETEHDNLRAALERAIDHGDAEHALRVAGALMLFWRVRGHFREGRRWLETALALDGHPSADIEAKALRGLGFLTLMLQDVTASIPPLERALALDRKSGDLQGQARSLLLLANALTMTDPTGPAPLFEESAELARRAEDHWCLGHALAMLARSRLNAGDDDTGRSLLEECVRGARDAGELQSLRIGLYLLGNLALAHGEHPAAEAMLSEGLMVTRRLGEPFDSGAALQSLGQLALVRGDHGRARSLFEEALRSARQTGQPGPTFTALCSLGGVALRERDTVAAEGLLAEAEAAASAAGTAPNPTLHQGFGEVALARGDTRVARSRFTEALELAEARGERASAARARAGLAEVSRRAGERRRASEQHQEALVLRGEIGDIAGIAESLDAIAGLAAEAGRFEDATRLLGAADHLRDGGGFLRSAGAPQAHEEIRAASAAALRPGAFAAAWAQGMAMSAGDAIAYVLRGCGTPGRPRDGWASLTRSQRRIASLVVEGLTNIQVAQRLFITESTVEGHLTNIFGKLGVGSRAQLVREGMRREMTESS